MINIYRLRMESNLQPTNEMQPKEELKNDSIDVYTNNQASTNLEQELLQYQALQNNLSYLQEKFEVSSTASQNLQLDVRDFRELKALSSPPKMVVSVMEIAFLCIKPNQKKVPWGDVLKELANPRQAIGQFQSVDYG